MTKKGQKLASCDAMGIEKLCEDLIAGKSQTEIAASIGVSLATLINWIAADPERSAHAREARTASASSFSDLATAEIRAAKNKFQLAKARELASHFRWKASKANPREFGEKIEIDQRTTVTDLTEEQLDARLAALRQAESDALDAQQG